MSGRKLAIQSVSLVMERPPALLAVFVCRRELRTQHLHGTAASRAASYPAEIRDSRSTALTSGGVWVWVSK